MEVSIARLRARRRVPPREREVRELGNGGSFLFSLGRECEQHVSGHGAEPGVARDDKDHSPGDDGSADVERAAVRGDLIYGVEITRSVEIPDNFSVAGGVGAQVAVDRA